MKQYSKSNIPFFPLSLLPQSAVEEAGAAADGGDECGKWSYIQLRQQ